MKRILEYAIELINHYKNGDEFPKADFATRRIDGLLIVMGNKLADYTRLEDIANKRWSSAKRFVKEITIITDDIAIVEVQENDQIPMYYKIINGNPTSTYSHDKEIAILEAIGEKHKGFYSDFARYAVRMLRKDLPE